jgi:hypothetical protein
MCTSLKIISDLPNLEYLNCCTCTELEVVSQLPKLSEIFLGGCTKLQLHTLPLKLLNIEELDLKTITQAVENDDTNLEYLQSCLNNSILPDNLVEPVASLLDSSILVKSAKFV